MEILDNDLTNNAELSFKGQGAQYFSIWIVNIILTIITLGLYYPWAKAADMRFFAQETELDNSRFQFHGTGKEMFIGFLKAIGIIILVYGIFFAMVMMGGIFIFLGFLFLVIVAFALIPFAIHGSMRYRTSRTSWRGIHMGYRGDFKVLFNKYFTGVFLVLITFGIYSFWFTCQIRKYIISHLRFGNITFDWNGKGQRYFGIFLGGYILTLLTLGIYSFWWIKNLYDFFVDNLSAEQDGRSIRFKSTATASRVFSLFIGNFFLAFFTLGLGIPWAIMRTMRFTYNNMEIIGEIDAERLQQTEEEYKDAMGEDFSDMMDIGLV